MLPCPSLSPRVFSDSYPLSLWCYLNFSSSATLFSFFLQSFSASGSFPMSQLFTPVGQNIGASASASFFPLNIQGCFSLELTGLISLQSKGFSRLLQHHNLKASVLPTQSSLLSNSLIHTWLQKKNRSFMIQIFVAKVLKLLLQHHSFRQIFRVDFL